MDFMSTKNGGKGGVIINMASILGLSHNVVVKLRFIYVYT